MWTCEFYFVRHLNLDYTNRPRFADRDIFARYAVTGVGHDAVHLARHAHGLVDNDFPTDNEEEDITEMEEPGLPASGETQSDGKVDEEDEGSEGSDSSESDAFDDSDLNSDCDPCF